MSPKAVMHGKYTEGECKASLCNNEERFISVTFIHTDFPHTLYDDEDAT